MTRLTKKHDVNSLSEKTNNLEKAMLQQQPETWQETNYQKTVPSMNIQERQQSKYAEQNISQERPRQYFVSYQRSQPQCQSSTKLLRIMLHGLLGIVYMGRSGILQGVVFGPVFFSLFKKVLTKLDLTATLTDRQERQGSYKTSFLYYSRLNLLNAAE